jgi:hypothetical protein
MDSKEQTFNESKVHVIDPPCDRYVWKIDAMLFVRSFSESAMYVYDFDVKPLQMLQMFYAVSVSSPILRSNAWNLGSERSGSHLRSIFILHKDSSWLL